MRRGWGIVRWNGSGFRRLDRRDNGLQRDIKAEFGEPLDETVHDPRFILLIKIVGTPLPVVLAAAEHAVSDQQQLMSQSENRLIVSEAAALAPVESRQISVL